MIYRRVVRSLIVYPNLYSSKNTSSSAARVSLCYSMALCPEAESVCLKSSKVINYMLIRYWNLASSIVQYLSLNLPFYWHSKSLIARDFMPPLRPLLNPNRPVSYSSQSCTRPTVMVKDMHSLQSQTLLNLNYMKN